MFSFFSFSFLRTFDSSERINIAFTLWPSSWSGRNRTIEVHGIAALSRLVCVRIADLKLATALLQANAFK
ncbi:hypothetical protein Trco_000604 [Trichoderma cornu-damae]|uniref:Uncharacterized protein n=1 Tax=Trichoderma cornu-damae TaxID=654480 RepID=A0A9P8U0H3_9HYPO|nr:hypothetical protein Trco_000604 [Trichoderma cornu-damae]